MPDRQKLIEELEWNVIGRSRKSGDKYVVTLERRFVNSIIDLLQSQQQIVRCKDCHYWSDAGILTECSRFNGMSTDEGFFCAYGKPKGGDGE